MKTNFYQTDEKTNERRIAFLELELSEPKSYTIPKVRKILERANTMKVLLAVRGYV